MWRWRRCFTVRTYGWTMRWNGRRRRRCLTIRACGWAVFGAMRWNGRRRRRCFAIRACGRAMFGTVWRRRCLAIRTRGWAVRRHGLTGMFMNRRWRCSALWRGHGRCCRCVRGTCVGRRRCRQRQGRSQHTPQCTRDQCLFHGGVTSLMVEFSDSNPLPTCVLRSPYLNDKTGRRSSPLSK